MMKSENSVAIVIPVFNNSAELFVFLPTLLSELSTNTKSSASCEFHLVIVDDGSQTGVRIADFSALTLQDHQQVHLLRHVINLGQGAALQTGIQYARSKLNADYFVTMDSDGQHSENDLFPMLEKLKNSGSDVVFGSRFSQGTAIGMPVSRKMLLKCAVLFEKWLTGLKLNDAHNGYRVFNKRCAQVIELKLNRMAHATEFKQLIQRHKLKYVEHPVTIKYTAESLARGQKNSGSLIILRDLLKTYLFERL